MVALIIIMIVAFSAIFYAMIGYPILLILLDKIKKHPQHKQDLSYEPTVSYMIVAHNEEAVIKNKLLNALEIDYPKEKLQIIVTSDFSTDKTNEIVEEFIKEYPDYNIILHRTVEHKGKTNAQNEAQKLATGIILVMTDANAMMKKDAIRQLVSYFVSNDIAYVCGKLSYVNTDNITGASESTYWDFDLKMRDIESRIQTITAGNGSIYAVRTKEYIIDPSPMGCHDGFMPYQYACMGKRCIFNPDAISYEKAGEDNHDEFKRKVRMGRGILGAYKAIPVDLNVFKYKWFSVFYFGHRTCRYFLWINHIIFLICSILFAVFCNPIIGGILTVVQLFCIALGLYSINHQINNKYIRLLGYYAMTILAQIVAAAKQMAGKSKATWEKAETTR